MLGSVCVFAFIFLVVQNGSAAKKNVLFLVSDDMRPQINAWEGPDFPSQIHPKMHTPNLDVLAAKSLLLKRAYVQQATLVEKEYNDKSTFQVCSPSRTSLLTGRRPDTTHIYDLFHYFRTVGGNYTTIPEYFKLNGYTSVGMGKIFHPGHASNNDDPPSWSEPYFQPPNEKFWTGKEASWIAVSKERRAAKPLPDEQTAQHAISWLKKLAKKPDQPFFLAAGFHKPHLPFVFPEEFLDFYPEHEIQVPDNQYAPVDMPDIAWWPFGGLRAFRDIKPYNATGHINTTFPADVVKKLRRAYYSALSYTDSLVGDVIKVLEDLGLANNTIVSFWGDHGWQLGEHGEWCKQTNFELATHAPMMVHIPGLTDDGIVTEQLTEYVDLFPTLVEAAELPSLPLCPVDSTKTELCREGVSLMPLIKDPNAQWKERVFSQYPREGNYMGYTMRTDRYRYTEWVKFLGAPTYKPDWSVNKGTELYDHQTDPEENHNRAHDPAYKSDIEGLSKMLHDGWRAALPETTDATFHVQQSDQIGEKIDAHAKHDENILHTQNLQFKDNAKFDIL